MKSREKQPTAAAYQAHTLNGVHISSEDNFQSPEMPERKVEPERNLAEGTEPDLIKFGCDKCSAEWSAAAGCYTVCPCCGTEPNYVVHVKRMSVKEIKRIYGVKP